MSLNVWMKRVFPDFVLHSRAVSWLCIISETAALREAAVEWEEVVRRASQREAGRKFWWKRHCYRRRAFTHKWVSSTYSNRIQSPCNYWFLELRTCIDCSLCIDLISLLGIDLLSLLGIDLIWPTNYWLNSGTDGHIDPHIMFDFVHLTQEGYTRVLEPVQVAVSAALNPWRRLKLEIYPPSFLFLYWCCTHFSYSHCIQPIQNTLSHRKITTYSLK